MSMKAKTEGHFALLIKVDGSVRKVPVTGKLGLEEVYRLIGCDTVERVHVTMDTDYDGMKLKGCSMLLDENGKILAKPKQLNPIASHLAWPHVIVGDVLVVRGHGWGR